MSAPCDLDGGICMPPSSVPTDGRAVAGRAAREIVYVGDPLCSWCWGVSPALKQLQAYAETQNLPFNIVVGGLRPGGGDPWTPRFQAFLRHHWEEIGARSGQPFSFAILSREHFNYDTEPPCRAIVVAREMLRNRQTAERVLYAFFCDIQEKFYVANQDPAELSFYESICARHELDFSQFSLGFDSEAARAATLADFSLCQRWGINAFPTVILRQAHDMQAIARGFASGAEMIAKTQSLLVSPDGA